MFPLWDEIPTRKIPFITILIIVLNCLVYYYQTFIFPDATTFVYAYGLIPYEVFQSVDLFPPGPSPIQLTVISSMFMHGSFVHLLGNMLYLWIFGNNVEDYLGKFRFIHVCRHVNHSFAFHPSDRGIFLGKFDLRDRLQQQLLAI